MNHKIIYEQSRISSNKVCNHNSAFFTFSQIEQNQFSNFCQRHFKRLFCVNTGKHPVVSERGSLHALVASFAMTYIAMGVAPIPTQMKYTFNIAEEEEEWKKKIIKNPHLNLNPLTFSWIQFSISFETQQNSKARKMSLYQSTYFVQTTTSHLKLSHFFLLHRLLTDYRCFYFSSINRLAVIYNCIRYISKDCLQNLAKQTVRNSNFEWTWFY